MQISPTSNDTRVISQNEIFSLFGTSVPANNGQINSLKINIVKANVVNVGVVSAGTITATPGAGLKFLNLPLNGAPAYVVSYDPITGILTYSPLSVVVPTFDQALNTTNSVTFANVGVTTALTAPTITSSLSLVATGTKAFGTKYGTAFSSTPQSLALGVLGSYFASLVFSGIVTSPLLSISSAGRITNSGTAAVLRISYTVTVKFSVGVGVQTIYLRSHILKNSTVVVPGSDGPGQTVTISPGFNAAQGLQGNLVSTALVVAGVGDFFDIQLRLDIGSAAGTVAHTYTTVNVYEIVGA